jgi:hypothetical protein
MTMKLVSMSEAQGGIAAVKQARGPALRRRHLRYPLAAEVKYQWSIRNVMRGEGQGQSRDVSESGAFVLSRAIPPVGAAISLEIQLPAWQLGATALRMEMTGEVVRVDVPPGRENGWGFAIASAKTILRRPDDRESPAQ